ncbi:hypothetical protein A6E01_19425 (plasmid) [Vibrio breoganii]|uniref:Uncharacterized protein n=1 Tax=Vibrio breoganii TaxID=553239 RepID=A0AAN0XZM4_9VIBR|nr:hypothetical protein A6E01_19425 [Vibrio breoganii]PML12819.1 hypothetical protein BCT84_02080 [Vibrio breoganii]
MTGINKQGSSVFIKRLLAFREEVWEEIHPLQMIAILEVLSSPSYTVSAQYMSDKYGISQASASRHCRKLTHRASPTTDGYGLCEWIFDGSDHRTKYLSLTAKGRETAGYLGRVFM